MKHALVLIVVVAAMAGYAQGLRNRSLLNRLRRIQEEKFRQNYPAGTNEYGRTWAEEDKYVRNKEYRIKSYSPDVKSKSRIRRPGINEPVFGDTYVLGMIVGTLPTNCIANVLPKPMFAHDEEAKAVEDSKKTWCAGDGIVTIAVCVGEASPPLDGMRLGARPRALYRDFSYSSDGRLVRISEPYVLEPRLVEMYPKETSK